MAGRPRKSENDSIADAIGNGGGEGADISASANGSIFPSGAILIDPSAIGEDSGSNASGSGNATGEPVRKRRGRKPGSVNKKSNAPLDVNGLEAILLSAHAMLAGLTQTEAMKIDQEESHQLAVGISNVARHYDVGATEKTLDWCNLFMALGVVYGPRLMLMRINRKPKPKPEQQPVPVQAEDLGNGAVRYPFMAPGAVPQ